MTYLLIAATASAQPAKTRTTVKPTTADQQIAQPNVAQPVSALLAKMALEAAGLHWTFAPMLDAARFLHAESR